MKIVGHVITYSVFCWSLSGTFSRPNIAPRVETRWMQRQTGTAKRYAYLLGDAGDSSCDEKRKETKRIHGAGVLSVVREGMCCKENS